MHVRGAKNWSSAIISLPEWCFKFALNVVTGTLPHNTNLIKWKKLSSSKCQLCGEYQFLAHVLNSCEKAHQTRQGAENHLQFHWLPSSFRSSSYFLGHIYSFPKVIPLTDQQPDIVLWSPTAIILIELTVPFETNISGGVESMMDRYRELRD